jgi:hypothetical protein
MIKKSNLKKVTYYLSVNQISDLKVLAEKTTLSVGALIRQAVNQYLMKNK